MEYELDSLGYVLHVYFGCSTANSTAYSGNIPNGYQSLEDWAENANIRAYKIVSNNLTLDVTRQAELEALNQTEHNNNRYVTYKELTVVTEALNVVASNSLYNKANEKGNIVSLDNAKAMQPTIKITNILPYLFDKVNLFVTGKNMLPNEAATQTISGVTFTQNEDRSITINGTATSNIEYDIAGTSTNTSPFLVLKKDIDYYLSIGNLTLKMYDYDGTDRTQIFSGSSGAINVSTDLKVTQITLAIASNTTFNNVTIYPQLELGTSATGYEEPKFKTAEINYNDYIIQNPLTPSNTITPSDNLTPKNGTVIDYILIEEARVTALINNVEASLSGVNIPLFDGTNNVFAIQDVYLDVTYFINETELATKAELSLTNQAITAEVTRATNEEDTLRAALELKIDVDDNDQVVSMVNAVANQVTITSDNFNLSADGEVTASEIHVTGGEISLNDDGTAENAALQIKRVSTEYKNIEAGNDYSSMSLYVDAPTTYSEFINLWAGNRTLLTTTDNKKITTVQEIIGTVQHTVGWKYKVMASWLTNPLFELDYNQEEVTTTVTQNTPITLPSSFNVLGIASGSTMFEWLKIVEKTEHTTSYAGNGMSSEILTDNELTYTDFQKIQNYLNGTGTLTANELIKYDFNGDGIVNVQDLLHCGKLIFPNVTKDRPGEFIINTEDLDGNLVIKDGDGNTRILLGLKGCEFNSPPHGIGKDPITIDGATPVVSNDGIVVKDISVVNDTPPYLKVTDSLGNEYAIDMRIL